MKFIYEILISISIFIIISFFGSIILYNTSNNVLINCNNTLNLTITECIKYLNITEALG